MKFTKPLLITKLKATGIHLSISVLIFVYLTYLIVFDWYPEPYFAVDGGWQGIRLVGAVDLVLGPLLTFLIYDNRKSLREIVFDLLTIAVIQVAALAYGVHTTYSQRPIAIVLLDEFMTSSIEEHYAGTLTSQDRLRDFSDEHPPIIYADLPLDRESLEEIQRIKVEQKVLEHAQIDLYRPREALAGALQSRQLLFASRLDSFAERPRYDAWLGATGSRPDEVLIAPFSGRYGRVWLVFDLDGRYLDYF